MKNAKANNVRTNQDKSAKSGKAPKPYRVRRFDLPRKFVFGASTSAYQIEGAVDADGRGPSIWEKYFEERPTLDNGAVACDHYNRMKEDVQMIKRMGLKAYRFSISWSRIMPTGRGKVNEAGLEFYSRLVDELLANGIEPYVTLYHWDLPLALSEEFGGWTSREVAQYFADYAVVVAHHLGDRVKYWCTFNEPEVIVAGYIGGGLAPGLENARLRTRVVHTLMYAHGLATRAMRAVHPHNKYGIVLNLVPIEPSDADNAKACAFARRRWLSNYAVYLEALLKGRYPDVVLDEMAEQGVHPEPGDMSLIAQSLDYLGVNWYLRFVCDDNDQIVPVPGAEVTQMGWEMHPPALTRMLLAMDEEYFLPPIYITENGAALDDTVEDGRIHDKRRTQYLYEHIEALERASAGGVKIKGYFAWSLMDNLEWSLGYKMTFGIVHVDRQTLARTVKDSGRFYGKLIALHHKKDKQSRRGGKGKKSHKDAARKNAAHKRTGR